MNAVRLWMVQVSDKQLQLFEKEVETHIHQDKSKCYLNLSVPPVLNSCVQITPVDPSLKDLTS